MGASAQAAQYDCTMKMFEQVPVIKYEITSPGDVELDLENGIPASATIVSTTAFNPQLLEAGYPALTSAYRGHGDAQGNRVGEAFYTYMNSKVVPVSFDTDSVECFNADMCLVKVSVDGKEPNEMPGFNFSTPDKSKNFVMVNDWLFVKKLGSELEINVAMSKFGGSATQGGPTSAMDQVTASATVVVPTGQESIKILYSASSSEQTGFGLHIGGELSCVLKK